MSAAGTVARLRASFEGPQLPGLGDGGAVTPGSAAASQQRKKRVRLWSAYPPVPSPSEGMESGAGAAAAGGEGLAGRQLWPADQSEGGEACGSLPQDEAARAARLEKIWAKFGTKVFHAAKEVQPAELLQQLGAAESDLQPEDYKLLRWEPMPVLLNSTSNSYCRNFVLKGLSGCVGLASSLSHLFVLGAGQTIWIAEADAVHAERREQEASGDMWGVFLHFGEGDFLTLKTDDASAAAVAAAVNERAAKRAALRRKAGDASSSGSHVH
ncbi:hypothetical protein ABPG75_004244 [Micractinium tetrahymenae]